MKQTNPALPSTYKHTSMTAIGSFNKIALIPLCCLLISKVIVQVGKSSNSEAEF